MVLDNLVQVADDSRQQKNICIVAFVYISGNILDLLTDFIYCSLIRRPEIGTVVDIDKNVEKETDTYRIEDGRLERVWRGEKRTGTARKEAPNIQRARRQLRGGNTALSTEKTRDDTRTHWVWSHTSTATVKDDNAP